MAKELLVRMVAAGGADVVDVVGGGVWRESRRLTLR